ncbi:hypothetical protein, partial [Streptomyces prasinus]
VLPAGPDGEPHQQVRAAGQPVDFAAVVCAGGTADRDARVEEFTAEPFDISRELPLRVRLFTAPDTACPVLVLLLHHVA